MDSKVVNQHIRKRIRPLLKENGFTKFTTRNAWRYCENVIDVINFQSFNSYNADVMGVTTFSFSVNLGCFHLDIPSQFSNIKSKSGFLCPEEYECSFRGSLKRSFSQKELDRNDIWFIDEYGSNVENCIEDARQQILDSGLKWFSRLGSKEALQNTLLNRREVMGELWGFGNIPSPSRSYLLGYVELLLGNDDKAKIHFNNVIESGCYSELFKTADEAIARAF